MTLYRPRRLQTTQTVRDLVSETAIMPSRLIMPHFVREGSAVREVIESMPGIERVCLDNLLRDVEADLTLGIRSLLLFGIPDEKDETGSGAWNENGIVQRAVTAVQTVYEYFVIPDLSLCECTRACTAALCMREPFATIPLWNCLQRRHSRTLFPAPIWWPLRT